MDNSTGIVIANISHHLNADTSHESDVSVTDSAAMSSLSNNVSADTSTVLDKVNIDIISLPDDIYTDLNDQMAISLMPTLIYIGFLLVTGVVGNTVVFIVYYKRFKPSAIRSYILAMSVFDLSANILSLPGEIIDMRFYYTFDIPWLCKIFRFINSFLTLVSAFLLVSVALDRHKKICHPLKKQRSEHQINISIAICTALSFVLTIPFIVLNGNHTFEVTGLSNVTGVTCSIDDVYKNTLFPLIYNGYMGITFIACLTTMIVCYSRIIRQILVHRKRSSKVDTGIANDGGPCAASGGWLRASAQQDESTSDSKNESASSELHPSSSTDSHSTSSTSGPALSLFSVNASCDGVPSTADRDVVLVNMNKKVTLESSAVPYKDCHFQNSKAPRVTFSSLDTVHSEYTESTDQLTSLSGEDSHPEHPSSEEGGVVGPFSYLRRLKSDNIIMRVLSRAKKRVNTKRVTRTKQGNGKKLTGVKQIPYSTTFTMFVLTAIFIINYLPHLVIISARAVSDDIGKGLSGALLNAYNIGLRSYFINCAVNPIVYSFCSAKFRQECRHLAKSMKPR